jgi:hypothetical protein
MEDVVDVVVSLLDLRVNTEPRLLDKVLGLWSGTRVGP